jgi:hypothetical protein
LEYSRFLREQWLAELAQKENAGAESPEVKKKGFWTLFFSQSRVKKGSGKVAPGTESQE